MTRSIVCAHCGKEFTREVRHIRSPRQFCSSRCFGLSKGQVNAAAFWSNTTPMPSGCIHWNGQPTTTGGYGVLKVCCKVTRAHRHAWTLSRGVVPEGLFVCHRCDNPICVNPEHLFLGTAHDNMRDMVRKGRSAGAARKGEKHPMVRLTDEQVREIRARYVNKRRYGNARQLAAEFGLNHTYLWALAVGHHRPEAGGTIHPVRYSQKVSHV